MGHLFFRHQNACIHVPINVVKHACYIQIDLDDTQIIVL